MTTTDADILHHWPGAAHDLDGEARLVVAEDNLPPEAWLVQECACGARRWASRTSMWSAWLKPVPT